MAQKILTVEEVEKIEDTLVDSHTKEAKRKKAKINNLGWWQEEDVICSKTSKGYLTSEINIKTLKVKHRWENYE